VAHLPRKYFERHCPAQVGHTNRCGTQSSPRRPGSPEDCRFAPVDLLGTSDMGPPGCPANCQSPHNRALFSTKASRVTAMRCKYSGSTAGARRNHWSHLASRGTGNRGRPPTTSSLSYVWFLRGLAIRTSPQGFSSHRAPCKPTSPTSTPNSASAPACSSFNRLPTTPDRALDFDKSHGALRCRVRQDDRHVWFP
jgi:hypothetical protein